VKTFGKGLMEEKEYRKPNFFHYLANKLIFGDRNAVTGDTFRIYTYEPHREGLEVKEILHDYSGRFRILELGDIGYIRATHIEGNGIAKIIELYFKVKEIRYTVCDTIFSNVNYERYDENFKKISQYAIVSVSMLIEALETKSFHNIPMIVNDLPEIAQLLILHRETWAEE